MSDEFELPEAARRMNGEVWENPGEAFVGTCDAGGGCNDDTFAIVLTDDGCVREKLFILSLSGPFFLSPFTGSTW